MVESAQFSIAGLKEDFLAESRKVFEGLGPRGFYEALPKDLPWNLRVENCVLSIMQKR